MEEVRGAITEPDKILIRETAGNRDMSDGKKQTGTVRNEDDSSPQIRRWTDLFHSSPNLNLAER